MGKKKQKWGRYEIQGPQRAGFRERNGFMGSRGLAGGGTAWRGEESRREGGCYYHAAMPQEQEARARQ
jgi:hypothetical protein